MYYIAITAILSSTARLVSFLTKALLQERAGSNPYGTTLALDSTRGKSGI
jgi:hypothetical protein